MTCFLAVSLEPEAEEVEDADGHDEDGSDLPDGIAGKAHEGREDGAAADAHDEQAADFVLLLRYGLHGTGKDDAEGIAIAEAHQGNAGIDDGGALSVDEAEGGCHHQQDTQEQEGPVLEEAHDEATAEAACSLGYKVDGADEGGIVEAHAGALHQDLRGCDAGADIDAYMADDGQEAKQDEGIAQQ